MSDAEEFTQQVCRINIILVYIHSPSTKKHFIDTNRIML